MSLQTEINQLIGKYIGQYIDQIVSKYSIDKDELSNMWANLSTVDSDKTITTAPVQTTPPVSTTAVESSLPAITTTSIMNANLAELKAMCKARKLMCGGKKQDLIDRLTPLLNNSSESSAHNSPPPPAPKKKKRSPNRMPQIPISSIQIKKNEHNNYEHPETKLIFDKESKQVIGRQQDDGTISTLTEEDIQLCDQFKFSYTVPEKIQTNADRALATSASKNEEIIETLDDIIASDNDDDEFEEFYEEVDE
jgi:hypothetical protein